MIEQVLEGESGAGGRETPPLDAEREAKSRSWLTEKAVTVTLPASSMPAWVPWNLRSASAVDVTPCG